MLEKCRHCRWVRRAVSSAGKRVLVCVHDERRVLLEVLPSQGCRRFERRAIDSTYWLTRGLRFREGVSDPQL